MPGRSLRFLLDTGVERRAVEATVGTDDVTVADVLAAAGCAPPTTVDVDGRSVPTHHAVAAAGIVDGATVACLPPDPTLPALPADRVSTVPRLAVVAGAGAGAAVPLDGPVVVGRDPACDLVVPSRTVSRRHCSVAVVGDHVAVVDLATTNGTWADGRPVGEQVATVPVGAVLQIGAVVLRVEPAPLDDRPRAPDPAGDGGQAGVPFNRPPRPGPPPRVDRVAVPDPGRPAEEAPPLPVAAVVAPIVLGAGMVVVLGSWRYAAFLVLSPLLVLAGAVAGRARARRSRRVRTRQEREAVGRFAAGLAAAAAAARQRSWELVPSVSEVVRRAMQPSTRLWERRPDHADVLRLHAGVGAVPWEPPVHATDGRPLLAAAQVVVERWSLLPRSPVVVDLAGGGVVGVVGERRGAVALARSLLLQACVHHGPADLGVAVATSHVADWTWSVWLPHAATASGRRRLAAGTAEGRALLASLRDHDVAAPARLVLLDDPDLLHLPDAAVRDVLQGRDGPTAGIVVAATVDQLPAVCDTIVEVIDPEGGARVVRPRQRTVVERVTVAGLDAATCAAAARRLAGLEDPEVAAATGALPRRVDLLDLLVDRLDVATAWDRASGPSGLRVPIGVGPDGPVAVDLVADGPHALLGGTTGAGKSELLRTLVAALAATNAPDRCTFVLVDYKGGAAFDACAALPHVAGVVTDLDEHLGERALRCLEAELAHRERRLRSAGVSDLLAWQRLPASSRGAPLPRLVVVVDEFATLRAELPDFVDALVGIAQRGRSLGVHLVLGTQRPSGAVDDNVRANVNVRIALRTTDDRDSVDVVGVADAAAIPPTVPGRGLLRTGPQRPVPVQTALVTGASGAARPRVRVAPVVFGGGPPTRPAAAAASGPTDLARLVAACTEEFAARGLSPPRTPWPPPLPSVLDLDDVATAPDVPVPYGLLDDPDRQRQVPVGWDPARGSLLVHGAVGSGTTTTLATVAIAAARRHDADALHLHVLDLGRGELAPLAALPHCGAVVAASEHERGTRLQALVLAEAERRRGLGAAALAAAPLHVLVVDGLGAWWAALDDPTTYAAFEAVQRLLVEAPRLRMAVVGSVGRPGAVRHSVVAATEQRLVHRLADPTDHAVLGLHPGRVPDLPPGRAVRPDGAVVQVARVDDLAAAVAAVAAVTPSPSRPPPEVGTLPRVLPWSRGRDQVTIGRDAWQVPVGVDAVALRPAAWTLHPGDHAVVLGPPGSGRSGLLTALAALAAPTAAVEVVAASPGAWPAGARCHPPDGLERVLAAAEARTGPTLVLVDDAERVPDPGAALAAIDASDAPVHLVAAARQDVVAADYGHWVRRLARARVGLFLQPTGDVPGDLLGVRLPRRPPLAVRPGRGWCAAAGEAGFVQVFGPPS